MLLRLDELELCSVPDIRVNREFPAINFLFEPRDYAIQCVSLDDFLPERRIKGKDYYVTLRSTDSCFTMFEQGPKHKERTLHSLRVQNTGCCSLVREGIGNAESPFIVLDEEQGGRMVGLRSYEDQRVDAHNSLFLDGRGVRTWLPIGGWFTESLFDEGKDRDIDWFKEKGFHDTAIHQSLWGRVCPITLQDIIDVLEDEHARRNTQLRELRSMMRLVIAFSQYDEREWYQSTHGTWRKVDSESIKSADVVQLAVEFVKELCRIMGENYHSMLASNITHGNLKMKNITLFGELCKNDEISDGVLASGNPKNQPGDLMGLKQFLDRFSLLILALTRKTSIEDISTDYARSFAQATFHKDIRDHWGSYDDYVERAAKKAIDQGKEVEIEDFRLFG